MRSSIIFAGIVGLCTFITTRLGLFGYTSVEIPIKEQNGSNSYGRNWFSVESGLLYNEVVEYEPWESGRRMRVATYGISMKPIKMSLD